jgi:hypothetical protein
MGSIQQQEYAGAFWPPQVLGGIVPMTELPQAMAMGRDGDGPTISANMPVLIPNTPVQVLYDHLPTEAGGLSLRKGEIATLVEMKEHGWCVLRTAAGTIGHFPLSYLAAAPAAHPVPPSIGHEMQNKEFWRKTWLALCLVTLLGVVASGGVGIWYLSTAHAEKYVMFWGVAALFVLLAVPISLHAIHLNMLYYRHKLQRFYIMILWMVPIYAIQSWLALYFWPQKVYLETSRECYEAYVIYAFVKMLMEALGDTEADQIKALEEIGREQERENVHHLAMCFNPCMPKWKLGKQFLRWTQVGVLQVCLPLYEHVYNVLRY